MTSGAVSEIRGGLKVTRRRRMTLAMDSESAGNSKMLISRRKVILAVLLEIQEVQEKQIRKKRTTSGVLSKRLVILTMRKGVISVVLSEIIKDRKVTATIVTRKMTSVAVSEILKDQK